MRRWALLLALLVAPAPCSAEPPGDSRRSGFEFMGASTQTMQRDDSLNPAMLWVLEGEQLWHRPIGAAGRSCASCHGDARVSMRAVAARHPAFDSASQRPVDLRQRIGACRQRQQPGLPPPSEEQAQLSLEAYVGLQSRGLPLAPPQDARLDPHRERGRALFEQRFGQLDLSCADCHDQQAGQRLGGSPIPQGHATGYPIYRLEWQGLGSLQRRLRACMSGVRAEPFTWNAPELVELELYLAWRARGMPVESPAVRP
jgi:L-cysteine S-thiosulfotransferase